MDERDPQAGGGMMIASDPIPPGEPAPTVHAVPGWQMTGADEPSDSAEHAVVWGVDPGGWAYSESGNPIEEES